MAEGRSRPARRQATEEDVEASRRRLEEARRTHGDDDERTVAAAEGLAMKLYGRREDADALELMRGVVTRWAQLRGAGSDRAFRARRTLAGLLGRVGEHTEAVVVHESVVETTVARHGERSRRGLASRYNHALARWRSGDTDAGVTTMRAIVAHAQESLEADDVVRQAAEDRLTQWSGPDR